jgi:hypothetical protein
MKEGDNMKIKKFLLIAVMVVILICSLFLSSCNVKPKTEGQVNNVVQQDNKVNSDIPVKSETVPNGVASSVTLQDSAPESVKKIGLACSYVQINQVNTNTINGEETCKNNGYSSCTDSQYFINSVSEKVPLFHTHFDCKTVNGHDFAERMKNGLGIDRSNIADVFIYNCCNLQ